MLKIFPRILDLPVEYREFLSKRRVSLALPVLAGGVLIATVLDRNPVSTIPLLRTVSGMLGVCLALLWAVVRSRNMRIRHGGMVWVAVLMGLIVFLDLARFLLNGNFAILNFLQWFQALLFGLILLDLARDYRAVAIIAGSTFLAILWVSLMAVAGGAEYGQGRVGADAFNLNVQAYYFGIVSIGSLAYLLTQWPGLNRKGLIAIILLVFMFVMALRTGSRGGLAAIIAGMSMVLLLMFRKRNISAYMTLVPLFLIGAAFLFLSSDVAHRWQLMLAGEDLGYRDVIWRISIDMFKNAPLLGHGAGFIEQLGDVARDRDTSTHNQYLMLLVSYGVTGLVLWFGLLFSVFRRCWRYRSHPAAVALIGMLVASLIYGFSADFIFSRYFWALIAIAGNVPIVVAAYSNEGLLKKSRIRTMVRYKE